VSHKDYDAIVIGAGPAGSTCAAILAMHGRRTLIVERAAFPRFHIGESLMPETYWVFERLGVLDRLAASACVKKYSVQFISASGRESAPFYFDEMNPHPCSQTWQVRRDEFDAMLLENAVARGTHVRQPANVVDIIEERSAGLPRVGGVVLELPGGQHETLTADVVVDATGTNALLSRRYGLRSADPALRKASVFAHYRGAYRDPDPRDVGATLVVQLQNQQGWFWYIPLHDDVVSIGVVGDIDYLIKGRGSPEATLDDEIRRCPFVEPRLAQATRVSPVHVLSDFSYNSRVCAGDGWVLIGDAFTFLDPMYSSGVFLALKSGELAADAIHAALAEGRPTAERLGAWGDTFYAGVQVIRKLVYAFYSKDFSFGMFNRDHPDQKGNLVDVLIGNVFRPGIDELFQPMARYVDLPESIALDSPAGVGAARP
jgi:flavin-dependent dehydrogenase